eukprot:CAMPEP_0113634766 /NCGR_PEP_ID=MMETSP0017_2-20120614/18111_1 /TAXON_ID=2856 /ORGANISM="Cylindrotheca closterium" /LENGTH=124 /DNA_ID=CAMNT_0000545495 /DNA_START=166 /DNA_END=540 /DNA_ORIENTATION=+ /assembly_acc=CAM_ASM_000147
MIIRERPEASLTPPSPPTKRHCLRMMTSDVPSSPCDSLCLPLLDHLEDAADEQENGLFLPTLAPRPSSSFHSFSKLSIKEHPTESKDEKPSFTLKKRSASAAFTRMPLQPRSTKQKVSVHALCA